MRIMGFGQFRKTQDSGLAQGSCVKSVRWSCGATEFNQTTLLDPQCPGHASLRRSQQSGRLAVPHVPLEPVIPKALLSPVSWAL